MIFDMTFFDCCKPYINFKSESGCWEWEGYTDSRNNNPLIYFYNKKTKKYGIYSVRKHMFSIFNKISLGKRERVIDKCGNVCCVNPEHLLESSPKNLFLSHIEKDYKTGCWNWTASKTKDGYGNFGSGKGHAHKFSYQTFIGKVPKGMDVCHTCDNRACCNPNHLFLASHLENMKDMVKKKRSKRGENAASSKLTEKEVLKIRKLLENELPMTEIANKFNVTPTTIRAIKAKKNWAWLR